MTLLVDGVGLRAARHLPEPQEQGPVTQPVRHEPGQPPSTKVPLTTDQQRVDDALQRLETAKDAITRVKNPYLYPYLARDVADAQANLKTTIDSELRNREKQLPPGKTADDATLQQWGNDIAARHPQNPARQTEINETVADIRSDRQVESIMAGAKTESDPGKALKLLSDGYAGAPPELQRRILAHPDAQGVIDRAVTWANEPLRRPMDKGLVMPQALTREAITRLDTVTRDLHKTLGAEVVNRAMAGYEQFNKDFQNRSGGQMFGPEGARTLMFLTGRIAGTTAGDAAVSRFAAFNAFDENSMRNALAEGASPAYLLELARQNTDAVDPERMLAVVRGGLDMHRTAIKGDLADYAKETEELQWLIQQHGSWMTDDPLQASINQYKAAKEAADPGWTDRVKKLEDKLATHGTHLLEQTAQLSKLPPELADRQSGLNDFLADTLGAYESKAAVSLALQKHPNVMAGDNGIALKNFFATVKSGHEARKLAPQIVNAYIKANVVSRLTDLDPNKPASIAKAQDALESLKGSAMAKLLGVTEADLGKAVDQVKATLPAKGESTDSILKKLQKLDATVSGLKSFQNSTFGGVVFRALGVIGAGASLINSGQRFANDPTWAPAVKLMTDASGLTRGYAELVKAVDRGGSLSTALAGKTASALTAFAALGDAALAIDAYQKGDNTAATFFGISAVGGALAAAPAVVSTVPALAASAAAGTAAAWLGPIGIGLIVVGTIGNALYQNHKIDKLHDTPEAAKFLEVAGFNDKTAKALVDQSGEGFSPVPLLMKYGQLHGLTADQTIQWLNNLSEAQLATTRDVVHRTLDELDGDITKFHMTASDDADYIEGAVIVPAASGQVPALSQAQLDTVLTLRDIPWPKV